MGIKDVIKAAAVAVGLSTADVPVTKPFPSCKGETPEQTLQREMLEEYIRANPLGSPRDLSKLNEKEFEIFLNDTRQRRYFFEDKSVGFEYESNPIFWFYEKAEMQGKDEKEEHEQKEKNFEQAKKVYQKTQNRPNWRQVERTYKDILRSPYSKTQNTVKSRLEGIEYLQKKLIEHGNKKAFEKSLSDRAEEVKSKAPEGGGALIVAVEHPPGVWNSHIAETGRTRKEALEKYASKEHIADPKANVVLVWAENMQLGVKESSSETQNATPNILAMPKSSSRSMGYQQLTPENLKKLEGETGIRSDHIENFVKHCKENDRMIVVRCGNPDAVQHFGKDGYVPKPLEVKLKTAKKFDNNNNRTKYPDKVCGLVVYPEEPISEADAKNLQELKKLKYTFENGILIDPKGNKVHADYDLQSVSKIKTEIDYGGTWEEKKVLRDELTNPKDKMGIINDINKDVCPDSNLIQHGAQRDWRNKKDADENLSPEDKLISGDTLISAGLRGEAPKKGGVDFKHGAEEYGGEGDYFKKDSYLIIDPNGVRVAENPDELEKIYAAGRLETNKTPKPQPKL